MEYLNHPLTQLILNPLAGEAFNMVAIGFYMTIVALIATAIMEAKQ